MFVYIRMFGLGLMLLFTLPVSVCAQGSNEFSFLVMGDTRSEPYLSATKTRSEMEDILRHRYHGKELVLELKNNKPITATIKRAARPLVLHYEGKQWPQRIDEFHNNDYRQIYTREGFDWVMTTAVEVLKDDRPTKPAFLIHGGDIVLNGYLGRSLTSPYWALMQDKLLRHLPKRVYAAVGNHETWEDSNLEGLTAAMPWLKDVGFRLDKRIYRFTKGNSLFIFLNSGPQCESESGHATDWCSLYPDYQEQMIFLGKELESAKKSKIKNIFVTYHKPSYIQVGHDPLPAEKNPHKLLKTYAKDFNIVVFNSHAHTTEHYLVDGIRYLVIGGGGAPQAFYPTTNPAKQTELYWKGKAREEEYNILQVVVADARVEAMLHRFRPGVGVSKAKLFNMEK